MEAIIPNTRRLSSAQKHRNNLSERIEFISVLLERFNRRQLSQKALVSELRSSAIIITDAFMKLCETTSTHELVLADVIQSLSNCTLEAPTGSSSSRRHQQRHPSNTNFVRHMYEPPSASKGKRHFANTLESSSDFADSIPTTTELDAVPNRDQRGWKSHGDIIAWSDQSSLSMHTCEDESWKPCSLKLTQSSIAFKDLYLQPKFANVDPKPIKRAISPESRQQCTKDVLAEHTRMWRQLAPKPIERQLSPNQHWHIELPKDYKPARPPFGIDSDGEESLSTIHTEGVILRPPFGINRCSTDVCRRENSQSLDPPVFYRRE